MLQVALSSRSWRWKPTRSVKTAFFAPFLILAKGLWETQNRESRIERSKRESSTLTQDGSKTYSNSTVVKTRFRTLRERMCDAVMRTTHHGLLLLWCDSDTPWSTPAGDQGTDLWSNESIVIRAFSRENKNQYIKYKYTGVMSNVKTVCQLFSAAIFRICCD
jgi:hypothetical protein